MCWAATLASAHIGHTSFLLSVLLTLFDPCWPLGTSVQLVSVYLSLQDCNPVLLYLNTLHACTRVATPSNLCQTFSVWHLRQSRYHFMPNTHCHLRRNPSERAALRLLGTTVKIESVRKHTLRDPHAWNCLMPAQPDVAHTCVQRQAAAKPLIRPRTGIGTSKTHSNQDARNTRCFSNHARGQKERVRLPLLRY